MTTRRPEPTRLFRTLPVSANTVRVSYVVEVPAWNPHARPERTRVFALLHDARRGWGVEDGRFEHSVPSAAAPIAVQELMRAARRAYEGLAKHGAIPDGVDGYLVVEHPGRKPDENLAAVTYPAPRSFAEAHDAVRLAHAAKDARYGIAVDHGSSARVFQGDSAVPHVEEFADGWRVWVPAKHTFVGDRDMQPFRTMADAVDHLDAVKAARRSGPKAPPAQRSLFGKANRRAATHHEGSTMPARRTTKPPATPRPPSSAPHVETLFPVLPVVDGTVSVTYAVNVPRPQSKGASASRKAFDRVPMFSLIHHPKRGWGIADDSFERSTWVDRGGPARERDFDLAHRAYNALANDWRFPDSMGGYLVVDDPASDTYTNLWNGSIAKVKNLRTLMPKIKEVRDAANKVRMREVALFGTERRYESSPKTPHVQQFADGWRVWVPATHAFVGGKNRRPFTTREAAERAMESTAAKRAAPEQFSLFAKTNSEKLGDLFSTEDEARRFWQRNEHRFPSWRMRSTAKVRRRGVKGWALWLVPRSVSAGDDMLVGRNGTVISRGSSNVTEEVYFRASTHRVAGSRRQRRGKHRGRPATRR